MKRYWLSFLILPCLLPAAYVVLKMTFPGTALGVVPAGLFFGVQMIKSTLSSPPHELGWGAVNAVGLLFASGCVAAATSHKMPLSGICGALVACVIFAHVWKPVRK